MTTLNRTISLGEVTYFSVLVACQLDFNMTGLLYKFFHVYAIILEGCQCFRFGIVVCFFNFTLFPNHTHTLATATSAGFEQDIPVPDLKKLSAWWIGAEPVTAASRNVTWFAGNLRPTS